MVRRTGEQVRDYKDSVFVGIVLVAFLPPESSSLMSSRFPSSEDSSGSWRFCWHGGGFCISPRKGSIHDHAAKAVTVRFYTRGVRAVHKTEHLSAVFGSITPVTPRSTAGIGKSSYPATATNTPR